MQTITDYETIDHGLEHEQYFQGCGVVYASFADVATGIGNSLREALHDAAESLAQGDWDVDGCAALSAEIEAADDTYHEPPTEDVWYYASIRVR